MNPVQEINSKWHRLFDALRSAYENNQTAWDNTLNTLAMQYLRRLLVDVPLRRSHIEVLLSWRKAFGPRSLAKRALPSEQFEQLVEQGPEGANLKPQQLAQLLLHPVDLDWLAETIDERLPDVWLDEYSQPIEDLVPESVFEHYRIGPPILPAERSWAETSSGLSSSVVPAYVPSAPAASGQTQYPAPRLLRWLSPNQQEQAVLNLTGVEKYPDDRTVTLKFLANDEPSTQLAHQPVKLGGIEATIDAQGQAVFLLGELRKLPGPMLELQVGTSGQIWTPMQKTQAEQ